MKISQLVEAKNDVLAVDSSATSFHLTYSGERPGSASDVVIKLLRVSHWGTVQELSPNPRTNQVLYSDDFSQPIWLTRSDGTGSVPIVTTNYGMAPDGSMTATRLQLDRGTGASDTDWSSLYQETPGLSEAETGSLWVRSNAGTVKVYLYTLNAVVLATITAQWQLASALQTNPAVQDDGATDTAVDLCIWHPQLEGARAPGVYIPTASTVATATDYSYTSYGVVSLDQIFLTAVFDWSGSANMSFLSARPTYLSQYANSQRVVSLVDYVNQWIDPSIDIDAFYDYVWNVQTAQGFGLDIWGKIVNVPRQITIQALPDYLGFDEALPGSFPFGQEPFYSGPLSGSVYNLTDNAYRVLIMTKALANISSFTAPSVNALLSYLFAGRGDCHVEELGGMSIKYVFNFALQPWEASVIQQPDLMPRPAGVNVTITVNP